MTVVDLSLANIMPNYKGYDDSVSDSVMKHFTSVNNWTPNTPSADMLKSANAQSVAGHTPHDLSLIEGLFASKINQYIEDSQKMVIYNDLTNVNTFAKHTVDHEVNRLTNLRDKTNADVIKQRKVYMSTRYETERTRFHTSIIQLTVFVIAICAMIFYASIRANKFDSFVAYLLFGIIGFLYIFAVIIMIRNAQLRRKDDWNKFYFIRGNSGNGASCGN